MTKREFTAIYLKRKGRFVAWIEEVPGVNTQGKTKKEAKENLKEALSLILEVNRKLASKQDDGLLLREPLQAWHFAN